MPFQIWNLVFSESIGATYSMNSPTGHAIVVDITIGGEVWQLRNQPVHECCAKQTPRLSQGGSVFNSGVGTRC
jgi:hypothetical protein